MDHIKSRDYLPEILAAGIFLPMGIFIGYMINFIQTVPNSDAYCGIYWSFFLGGLVAIITGITHVKIKLKYEEYKYEHFYSLMVGLGIFLITAGLMVARESQAAAFLGMIAHGMMYVSSLSYINIRTGYSKHRYLKLSLPHLVYLLGLSLGATLIWATGNSRNYFYGELTNRLLLMVTSFILLFGIISNELMFHQNKTYNYKKSLDIDINREIKNKELYLKKYFVITRPDIELPPNVRQPHPLETEPTCCGGYCLMVCALAPKVLTLIFFYYPFVYLFTNFVDLDINVFVFYWLAFYGFLISLFTMTYIHHRTNCILTIAIRAVCMLVIVLGFLSDSFNYSTGNKIVFCLLVMGLGLGFSHSDIIILSYTNLITNEIVLAAGYFIEHLIIGLLQYKIVLYPENIYDRSSTFHLLACIGTPFVSIFIGIYTDIIIPKGTHNSLLEIKNSAIDDAIRFDDKLNDWKNYA